VKFRCKEATNCWREYEHEDGRYIVLPSSEFLGSEHKKLLIVSSYKHLGTWVAADRNDFKDAKHKSQQALQAFIPIAMKVFGNAYVKLHLKLTLGCALVLSRLLYNVCIRVPSSAFMASLNTVYMRLMRRIYGEPRFGPGTRDYEFRVPNSIPSLDCVIMKKRLHYLKRLLAHGPSILTALLAQQSHQGGTMPWTKLIISDMCVLRDRKLQQLPHPKSGWREWIRIIHDDRWDQIVDSLYFPESALDSEKHSVAGAANFTCSVCSVSFATNKQKILHERVCHNMRAPARFYAFGHSQCLACKTQFSCRWRLLQHLSDSCRTSCIDELKGSNVEPLSESEVLSLDEADKVARKRANLEGRTQILSSKPATRDGRLVGRYSG